jgi:peptide chain release factor subunit 3
MSGLTGENIKEPVDAKTCPWYSGPTLIQALDGLPNEKRNPSGPLRIPVLDKTLDQGVIAHGKIESGTLNIGDKIQLWPSGYPAQVGSILDHKNAQVMYARPGENVQIKLIHIEDEKMIQKGDVICGRDNPIPVTMLFEAELDILELLDYKPIMSKGYTCIMHCHTFADDCVIKDILQAIEFDEKAQGLVTKMAPKFTKSFAKCHVRITTKYPIALEKYETIASLGRFTLRDEGKTIAIGRVTKYKPHKVDSGIVVAGVTQVTGQADTPKVTETKPDKNATLVFDMETGTTSVAEKKMDAIAEGDSGEDN